MARKLSFKKQQLNFYMMNELAKQHEIAKNKAINFMKKGQLNAYFNALIEQNYYEKLLLMTMAN